MANLDLSGLIFVLNNTVLDDAPNAIILSLIEQFINISTKSSLLHNIELSEYFAIDKFILHIDDNTSCENCEIILKYYSTINKIEFYVKQTNIINSMSTNIIYHKIYVFKIISGDNLDLTKINLSYDNKKETRKMLKSSEIIQCRSQTDALMAASEIGNLSVTSSKDIPHIISTVNNIISKTKKSINDINSKIFVCSQNPSTKIIKIAEIISNHINLSDASLVLMPSCNKFNDEFIMIDGVMAIVSSSKINNHILESVSENSNIFKIRI